MSRPRKAALPPALENIEKLQKVIEGGNYYGAQQMYKSISARYVSAERYSEALDILESGACLQLKHDQITCGAELAASFVDTLVKGKFPCNEEMLVRLRKIYEAFPRNAVPDQVGDDDDMQKLTEELAAAKIRVEGCSSFLKASLRWSIEFGSEKSGSPELHAMLGEYIYSESLEVDMSKVSYHYVRGNNPNKFASILVNFLEKCYPGEDDLAIARAVLMYLALGNLRDANYIMDEVKQKVESKELEFPKSELMELIVYLLKTLERDALPLFKMLSQNYQPSINRDPTFNELLDEIAERFYGVTRQNPMQGMFGDIFKEAMTTIQR
ncbi:protein GET4 isoform X2 [Silene latifolia]|uniref:protein GET4 isoform X2 n=1 Tax=Silene latifolia TaxID=37657 RepID=UPI003D774D15